MNWPYMDPAEGFFAVALCELSYKLQCICEDWRYASSSEEKEAQGYAVDLAQVSEPAAFQSWVD